MTVAELIDKLPAEVSTTTVRSWSSSRRPAVEISIRLPGGDESLLIARTIGDPEPTDLPEPYTPGSTIDDGLLQMVGEASTLHADVTVGEKLPLRMALPQEGRVADFTVEVLSIMAGQPEPADVTVVVRVEGRTVFRYIPQ